MQDKASGSQQPAAKRRKTKGGADDEVCFGVLLMAAVQHVLPCAHACIVISCWSPLTGDKSLLAAQDDSDLEIVKGLSGDEVDTSLIISGGRRARRGRAQFGANMQYQYEAKKDDSDDEW